MPCVHSAITTGHSVLKSSSNATFCNSVYLWAMSWKVQNMFNFHMVFSIFRSFFINTTIHDAVISIFMWNARCFMFDLTSFNFFTSFEGAFMAYVHKSDHIFGLTKNDFSYPFPNINCKMFYEKRTLKRCEVSFQ